MSKKHFEKQSQPHSQIRLKSVDCKLKLIYTMVLFFIFLFLKFTLIKL
jgi:hypothetical protein